MNREVAVSAVATRFTGNVLDKAVPGFGVIDKQATIYGGAANRQQPHVTSKKSLSCQYPFNLREHVFCAVFLEGFQQGFDIKFMMTFVNDTDLLHIGQAGFTGVFNKALIFPEEGAGHGGGDDQGIK